MVVKWIRQALLRREGNGLDNNFTVCTFCKRSKQANNERNCNGTT
jgi:hypothetical protein